MAIPSRQSYLCTGIKMFIVGVAIFVRKTKKKKRIHVYREIAENIVVYSLYET